MQYFDIYIFHLVLCFFSSSTRLRNIVITKTKPEFEKTLPKAKITKGELRSIIITLCVIFQ